MVLVHGLFLNSSVWERLTSVLASHARCVVPDLPLGGHRIPMNDADRSPPGLARMIAELIERLQLEHVTVVGNDTGGALCQILCATHPELVARLVLTNCDAFEHFPPFPFRMIRYAAGYLPGLIEGLDLALRVPLLRRAMANSPVTIEPLPDHLLTRWFEPLHDRRVRADVRAVLRGISARHTLQAAERLTNFHRPTLIVWGAQDKFFPLSDAIRLTRVLPCARLETIQNARTFVQLDQPRRLAELIIGPGSDQ
nr:alpha/beta hydrolase [Mycobacterium sp. 852002-40037_SCH5390672]